MEASRTVLKVQGRHRDEQIGSDKSTEKQTSALLVANIWKADPLQAYRASVPQRINQDQYEGERKW